MMPSVRVGMFVLCVCACGWVGAFGRRKRLNELSALIVNTHANIQQPTEEIDFSVGAVYIVQRLHRC